MPEDTKHLDRSRKSEVSNMFFALLRFVIFSLLLVQIVEVTVYAVISIWFPFSFCWSIVVLCLYESESVDLGSGLANIPVCLCEHFVKEETLESYRPLRLAQLDEP